MQKLLISISVEYFEEFEVLCPNVVAYVPYFEVSVPRFRAVCQRTTVFFIIIIIINTLLFYFTFALYFLFLVVVFTPPPTHLPQL